jgi:hypothetical protein
MCLLRRALFFSVTIFFFFFLAFGNFFRLIESTLFPDGWLVSEAFLYGLCIISCYFIAIPARHKVLILSSICLIFCSFFYGCYLQGFEVSAALYVARWSGALIAIYILFRICYDLFDGSIEKFFSYLCKAYTLSLLLGFVLYIFFPVSEKLWMWLEDNHVGFYGDPHIGRFVSVYFDPNYYACISVFIFLLTSYLYGVTQKKRYFFLSVAFVLSCFLTWSRSGIALLLAILAYQGYGAFTRSVFSRKRIYISLCFCLAGAAYLIIYQEETKVFLDRIVYFLEDESAAYRFDTFQFGLDLLEQYPLFGIGVNFLHQYTVLALGLNSLDSSLLALLVQIGIVPFVFLFGYACYKAFSFFSYNQVWKTKEKKMPHFLGLFGWYGLCVLLFASQFNNLLFYPFWLLPFGVTALFLRERCKERQKIYV